MSAPAIERRSTTAPARRSGPLAPQRIPAQRTQRAAERVPARERSSAARQRVAQAHAGRAKFVLVVMTLLVCALVATLWLSTAAAADSYRLQEARTRAGSLTEQSEQLRKEVTAMNSPSALAERAAAQGLVPVQDPARLVVAPDGRVDVVGEPVAARDGGPVPPAVPAAAVPAAPAAPADPAEPAEPAVAARPDTGDPAAAPGATTTGTRTGGQG